MLIGGLVLGLSRAAAAPPEADPVAPGETAICRIIETAAAANRVPVAYLTRLLWTESRFSSAAVSPAGAEGIAQFMPETAAERGLTNPWDPVSSIEHAARLLLDLDRRFGNLGLAAAAYNAGPARLAGWLQAANGLPGETRLYVHLVTGHPVEEWIERRNALASISPGPSCAELVAQLKRNGDRSRMLADLWFVPPVMILPDGDFVGRRSGRPITIANRLSLHRLLDHAAGLARRR